ncbi:MAG TPA: small ribosomal subunit Rsm22 family protein [Rhizobiaceae bacterium]|nr:small ribosomal subunit Rsm22 family protein [Rhizobiaceae bacterium]
MELPPALRQAVDRLLERTPLTELQKAAGLLSGRYRAEVRDGRLHLDDRLAVKAYLATRLPATYAAIRASLAQVAGSHPQFAPRALLDVGAGPGSVLWAASDCWPTLTDAVMLEASAAAREIGEQLAGIAPVATTRWLTADITRGRPDLPKADLVTLSYVLDEIAPAELETIVDRLWSATTGVLVIIEPGTPAGWRRVLAARERLTRSGAHLLAPCPHIAPCPLVAPDWCHFARRVARSRLHRLTKGGEIPWEDEKYIFVAASRLPGDTVSARVLAPPRTAKGMIRLKLCRADATVTDRTVTKREGGAFRAARRLDWGDSVEVEGELG